MSDEKMELGVEVDVTDALRKLQLLRRELEQTEKAAKKANEAARTASQGQVRPQSHAKRMMRAMPTGRDFGNFMRSGARGVGNIAARGGSMLGSASSAMGSMGSFALNSINSALTSVSGALNSFGHSLGRAGQGLQDFGYSIRSAIRVLGGMAAVGAGLGANAWMDIDYNKRGFETMMPGKRGKELWGEVSKMATETPFGIKDLSNLTRQAVAIGADYKDPRFIKQMEEFGNVVAAKGGGSEDFQRLIRAYYQIQQKGKLVQQEANQMAEAGISIQELVQKKYKLTRAELLEMQKDGKITAKMVAAAWKDGIKMYDGFMREQSRTAKGALQNTKDFFEQISYEVGIRLDKNFGITKHILKMNDNLDKVLARLKRGAYDERIAKFAATVKKDYRTIMSIIDKMRDKSGQLLKIWNGLSDKTKEQARWLAYASPFLGGILIKAGSLLKVFGFIFKLITPWRLAFVAIAGLFAIINRNNDKMKGRLGDIWRRWNSVEKATKNINGYIETAKKKLNDIWSNPLWQRFMKAFIEPLGPAWERIKSHLNLDGTSFDTLSSGNIWERLVTGFEKTWPSVVSTFTTLFIAAIETIKMQWSTFANGITLIDDLLDPEKRKGAFKRFFDRFKSDFKATIGSAWKDGLGLLTDQFVSVAELLANILGQVLSSALLYALDAAAIYWIKSMEKFDITGQFKKERKRLEKEHKGKYFTRDDIFNDAWKATSPESRKTLEDMKNDWSGRGYQQELNKKSENIISKAYIDNSITINANTMDADQIMKLNDQQGKKVGIGAPYKPKVKDTPPKKTPFKPVWLQ